MGKYDRITDVRLRLELTRFARILLELEDSGRLPEESARVLAWIGELRQMLFAWEVRHTRRPDSPTPDHPSSKREGGGGARGESGGDPGLETSLRIVREAIERERDVLEELEGDERDGADRADD